MSLFLVIGLIGSIGLIRLIGTFSLSLVNNTLFHIGYLFFFINFAYVEKTGGTCWLGNSPIVSLIQS